MTKTRKLILIADDFDETAETLGEMIEAESGFDTLAVKNGQEAVAEAVAHFPDVAVLDIDMPVLDGIDAAKEIRDRLGERRPLLIAHSGGVNAHRAALSGMFDYVLTKPTDFDQLLLLLGYDPTAR